MSGISVAIITIVLLYIFVFLFGDKDDLKLISVFTGYLVAIGIVYLLGKMIGIFG